MRRCGTASAFRVSGRYEDDLASGSPYNTRRFNGPPPTPIGNPGLASIRAAARPARSTTSTTFGRPTSAPLLHRGRRRVLPQGARVRLRLLTRDGESMRRADRAAPRARPSRLAERRLRRVHRARRGDLRRDGLGAVGLGRDLLERRRLGRLGAVRRLDRRPLRPARRPHRRRRRGGVRFAGDGATATHAARARRPARRLVGRAIPLRAGVGGGAAERRAGGGRAARERADRRDELGRLPARAACSAAPCSPSALRRPRSSSSMRRRSSSRRSSSRRSAGRSAAARRRSIPASLAGVQLDRSRARAAGSRARRDGLAARHRDRRRRRRTRSRSTSTAAPPATAR